MSAELKDEEAAAIAAGMEAVARADGEQHSRELELIEAFARDLGPATEGTASKQLRGAAREIYLRSLVMVAMADGVVSPEERSVIFDLAGRAGVEEAAIEAEILRVKRGFLRSYAEEHPLSHQVRRTARELGLDEADAEAVLRSGSD